INNLKQIGLAFKEWSLDNKGRYPMQVSVANGGAGELIATGDVASVFWIMSNELNTPKILICPADKKRMAATNFENSLSDSNISYFVGIDATTSTPAMFLSGDRNITNGVLLRRGVLELTTNRIAGWTTEIHTRPARNFLGFEFGKVGWGNVGFADGSVQQGDSHELNQWIQKCDAATNHLAIP
ncbi:MAG TPA: type II secretion system protein, partial [Verrucomicrobiae bacterium]|nr:type II secretion system protein [Verrucomicrobiae bacterium]